MAKKEPRGKLYYSLQLLSTLPLLFYGVIILFVGSFVFSKILESQTGTELQRSSYLVKQIIDTTYPGDYELVGESALSLMKGDVDITRDYALVDSIKKQTGLDITLFYQDTRILTTIKDWSGSRIVGTSIPTPVYEDVFVKGEEQFYPNTSVMGTQFFSYYMPLKNEDGTIVGVLFVGKSAQDIREIIQSAIYPLLIVGVITMILTGFIALSIARKMIAGLELLKIYFASVSNGNLHDQPDESLLKRKDELTEITQSAKSMQHSLRNMVEKDPLTELYNRRSGYYYFGETQKKAEKDHTTYAVALGDIDFFKKVNDTYGHEAGDVVLKNVAYQLRKHLKGKGYAIRWGGEEFLLVFDHCDMETASTEMTTLLDHIREMSNLAGETEIKVTMTFGIVIGQASDDINALIAHADNKLYYGKKNGRNRIVTEEPPAEESMS